jgi:hypothetical protein
LRSSRVLIVRWFLWLFLGDVVRFYQINPLVWLTGMILVPLSTAYLVLFGNPEKFRALLSSGRALSFLKENAESNQATLPPRFVLRRLEKITADAAKE